MTNEVIAVVNNVIRVNRATIGSSLLNEVRDLLTRENPAFHQMKSMKDRMQGKFQYMKLPPATISSFEEDDETVYVPRGYKQELIALVQSSGRTIKFYDETISYERNLDMKLKSEIQLREYQKKGLGRLVLQREGILVAPCGGGKTVTGIAIAMTLKQPTIILVHTNDLLAQWRRELAEKTILPGGIGQWGAGEKVRESVTVATIQTLVRMPPAELRALLDNFGCLILDEAHHCPADTFMGVVNLCAAKYRFGLTATPKRKDGLEFLMTDTIGPLLAEISDSDLQAEGRSQTCSVKTVHTTFFSRFTADEWTQLLAAMCDDKDRNRIIIENIVQTWNDGHFPLILSGRVGHCKFIVSQLRQRGMNAHMLVGEVSKNIREQIISNAKKNLIDAIVATSVADEGLDIPQLSCVHLVTPTANESKTQQRVGRIRRPLGDKKSLIVDYVDARMPSCLRMAKSRKSMYRRWGFKDIEGRDI